jgi:hypothetical protein
MACTPEVDFRKGPQKVKWGTTSELGSSTANRKSLDHFHILEAQSCGVGHEMTVVPFDHQ